MTLFLRIYVGGWACNSKCVEVKGQPGGAAGPLSPPDGSWGSNSGVWQEVPLLSEPSHQPNEFVLNEVFVRRIQNYLQVLLNIHEKQNLVKSRIRHCQSTELCWCYLLFSYIIIIFHVIWRGLTIWVFGFIYFSERRVLYATVLHICHLNYLGKYF